MERGGGGGGRFESYSPKIEGKAEGQVRLREIINPQQVNEQMRRTPDHTKSWTIYALLSKLIESGPELDPVHRANLRRLLWLFGLVSLPNLNVEEQASARKFNPADVKPEVTPEAISDVQWVFKAFDLQTPKKDQIEGLSDEDISSIFPEKPQK